MTLDDAIEYYSKIAESLRNQVRIEDNDYMDKVDEVYMCERLAEWLNELKLLRERIDAQPEQRWIPVTERLPKEDDYKSCIECLDGAVWYFTENGTIGLGYYYNSTKEWSTIYDLKTDGKVVAWMPLPEPYGGE